MRQTRRQSFGGRYTGRSFFLFCFYRLRATPCFRGSGRALAGLVPCVLPATRLLYGVGRFGCFRACDSPMPAGQKRLAPGVFSCPHQAGKRPIRRAGC